MTGGSPVGAGRTDVVLVAAVARHGVIGAEQGIPWRIPGEQRHFRELTMGHPMVMGRRTFESIGRVLPGRRTIVVTRDPGWFHEGVETAGSLPEAIALASESPGAATTGPRATEVMVAGGGQIYAEALPLAARLEITHVELDVDGDTVFPDIDARDWFAAVTQDHGTYRYVTYTRHP